jgi:hypothetical protein
MIVVFKAERSPSRGGPIDASPRSIVRCRLLKAADV